MIVGRDNEIKILETAYKSDYSGFIAVYGRRRVGKTFLVRETFGRKFSFSYSGMANVTTKMQLHNFYTVLRQHGFKKGSSPTNWIDAFALLAQYLENCHSKKKVVFLDELPWMDGPKSSFLPALENFWNGWASARNDVLLIVCGSATSWIVNKILRNRGGLHNRLTHQINLRPFTLGECEKFAKKEKLPMSKKLILEAYMILGGVPYYWSLLNKNLSLAQNIDTLFFERDAKLRNEFYDLYSSLFNHPEPYLSIITALAQKKVGMTREELVKASALAENGKIKVYLEDLENCGFIRKYNSIGAKSKKAIFQLIDNFTLFYFKFVYEQNSTDENYWTKIQNSPIYNNWCGYAFERICFLHTTQIKRALGISGILTSEYSLRIPQTVELPGAEIDLLLDRNDKAMNIIEIKYTKAKFVIDDKYMKILRNKVFRLQQFTKTNKSVFLTMLTTEGLVKNEFSGEINNEILAEVLFY